MATVIKFRYDGDRRIEKPAAQVMSALADFEKSIPATFPGVKTFKHEGNGVYRWNFEKLEHAGQSLELMFVTKLQRVSDDKIEMRSVASPGASQVDGDWTCQAAGNATVLKFGAELNLELNIPFFLKSVVNVFAQKELKKIFDRYLDNVSKTFAT